MWGYICPHIFPHLCCGFVAYFMTKSLCWRNKWNQKTWPWLAFAGGQIGLIVSALMLNRLKRLEYEATKAADEARERIAKEVEMFHAKKKKRVADVLPEGDPLPMPISGRDLFEPPINLGIKDVADRIESKFRGEAWFSTVGIDDRPPGEFVIYCMKTPPAKAAAELVAACGVWRFRIVVVGGMFRPAT